MTRASLRLIICGSAALGACAGEGRYAAWVSFDLSLVLLTTLLAALLAAALTALTARTEDRRHLALAWLIAFLCTFALITWLVAALTDHRVFVVESVFPYP
ncbi:MAG TPA: hypothetical protein PK095_19020 [Myxococcota bacterium]|nr:hypothetical protein [Myxococcota bacterium]